MPFFKKWFIFILKIVCGRACVRGYAHMEAKKRVLDLWELELDGCEPLNVGAGNRTLVLCKSIESFQWLRPLSSPYNCKS